jgi:hypothetical protein
MESAFHRISTRMPPEVIRAGEPPALISIKA